jgi:Protein of unknown function (DUF3147)
MDQIVIRFLIGGLTVSFFAAVGDVLKPKSFAGLFGAAPSVGLATLALTNMSEGKAYVAVEAHSMALASVAFFIYAWACAKILIRWHWHTALATTTALSIWFSVSFVLWMVFLK